MAVSFSSPLFEFVNFNAPPAICVGDEPPCLPVADLSDLAFQVIASVTGSDKTTFGALNSYPACITAATSSGRSRFENQFISQWTKTETGTGTNPDIWVGIYSFYLAETFFTALDINACFTISLMSPLLTPAGQAEINATTSTCFYKVNDTCYTSLVVFGNNSDAYGFVFTGAFEGWKEKIRLPLYLHSPVNAEEEKSYSKSDGSTKKLSNRIWKDYKFKTDYLDEATIEKIVVATSCDTVNITNPYSGIIAEGFVRTEKIEIDWQQEQMPLITTGQAKGTLRLADPRAYVNSNCQ